MTDSELKVIISGAGLIGLLTAQALKARNIDFVIFDRDESAKFRESAGWAITLHWSIDAFEGLVSEEIMKEVYECQVRPGFHASDTGSFKYINASTNETILSIPPSRRLRVRREQLRRTLLRDVDVHWNCKLEDIEFDANGVTAKCSNGQTFQGNVLLGCEGSNSLTRRLIVPTDGALNQLPIRFCGAKVKLTGKECDELARKFDPLLFQGTVPETGTFFWFSMLSCPEYNGEEDTYYSQVNLSWKIPTTSEEPFTTSEDKARAMGSHVQGLSSELRWLVDRAIEDPDSLVEIKLCDWPNVDWDHQNGSVLLVGDAAHAMTMYRGEAANHGIADVQELMKQVDSFVGRERTWSDAASNYAKAVHDRAAPAVLLSRQACIDAHDFSKISSTSESPLLSSRKKT